MNGEWGNGKVAALDGVRCNVWRVQSVGLGAIQSDAPQRHQSTTGYELTTSVRLSRVTSSRNARRNATEVRSGS